MHLVYSRQALYTWSPRTRMFVQHKAHYISEDELKRIKVYLFSDDPITIVLGLLWVKNCATFKHYKRNVIQIRILPGLIIKETLEEALGLALNALSNDLNNVNAQIRVMCIYEWLESHCNFNRWVEESS